MDLKVIYAFSKKKNIIPCLKTTSHPLNAFGITPVSTKPPLFTKSVLLASLFTHKITLLNHLRFCFVRIHPIHFSLVKYIGLEHNFLFYLVNHWAKYRGCEKEQNKSPAQRLQNRGRPIWNSIISKQCDSYWQRGINKILIPMMSLSDKFTFFKQKELKLINLLKIM